MSRVTAAPRGAPPDRFPPAPGGYYSLPSQTLSAGLTAAGFPAALSWLRGLGQRFRCGPARAAGAWALVLAFPAVVSSAGAADGPPALTRLAVPEGEAAGWRLYPAFDPAVRHYALRCGYRDALTLRLSAADPDTRLTVNGQPVAGHAGEAVLAGLAGDGDVVIRLRRGGASSSYVLHCLADDFPEIAATSRPGVSDGLILVSVWMQDEAKAYFSWIAMIDNHGVPRFRRRIDRLANSFKPHRNADFPFSYGREAGHSENPRDASWRSFEFVLLDRALEPRRVVRTVAPLTHTDIHDFVVRENGNVAFIAYEPARRDLSAIARPDGTPHGTAEAVEDSVIQEVAPDGREVFRWNSWDHLAPEDCTQHRFPWDYAHLNSLQFVDGDIVASFRGCSQVLRIDGARPERWCGAWAGATGTGRARRCRLWATRRASSAGSIRPGCCRTAGCCCSTMAGTARSTRRAAGRGARADGSAGWWNTLSIPRRARRPSCATMRCTAPSSAMRGPGAGCRRWRTATG